MADDVNESETGGSVTSNQIQIEAFWRLSQLARKQKSSPIFPNFLALLRVCEADQVLKKKMTKEKWGILFKIRFSTPTAILFSLLVVLL